MKRACWPLVVIFAGLLIACGGSEPVDEYVDDMSAGETSWEPGEWGFNVELDPWPVAAGSSTTLRAFATMDDYDEMFSGTVSYRLAPDGESPGQWRPMQLKGEEDWSKVYEAKVTLPEGTVGIHFKIYRANDETMHELTDWAVKVD